MRDHLSLETDPPGTPHVFAPGAAFVTDDAAWFLIDGDASRCLGPVLAWGAVNAPGRAVNILTEDNGGVVARRAALFGSSVRVWSVDDRTIHPAVPADHEPMQMPAAGHMSLAGLIESAGADVVIEHGVVLGEVRGLEMCRVTSDENDGTPRLEVGMGAHDREAFGLVHGHLPTEDALRQVLDAVLPHRLPGAVPHPLNQFGAERLMRWNAIQSPETVGCASLAAAEPPVRRTNLKDTVPCVAVGIDSDGGTVAVTFVHGADLDAVPFALDAADRLGTGRAVLVMRARDVTRSTETLVSMAGASLTLVRSGE